MSENLTLPVYSLDGKAVNSVEIPESIFGVTANTALMHQVVTAQLAAARQGTHAVKNRAAVSGGGKKPYRQKGTGNARQGSIRAPQFTGGAVAQGPVPRSYAQRTPKKMIAGALFGALSDRFRNDRIRVVEEVVSGQIPSTKSAQKLLDTVANYKKLLIVLTREDEVSWRSLANLQLVHSISYDQLNTYDVLSADAVIFTLPALHAFIAAKTAKKEVGVHS